MSWMVFAELTPDALKKSTPASAAAVIVLAFAAMMFFQLFVLA